MDASQLRTLLILERQQDRRTPDDWRTENARWVPIAKAMGKVEHKGGGDRLDVAQMRSIEPYEITVRYTDKPRPGDRWHDRRQNRHFIIDTVNDVLDKHEELVTRCFLAERVAQ